MSQGCPQDLYFYKKRVCIRFVEDKKNKENCKGCKKGREQHVANDSDTAITDWKSDTCTELRETDCYGEKQLSSSHNRKSKYIRIAENTEPSEFIQFMYSDHGWGLEMPKLILSVTGGAQNFRVQLRLKKAFKKGLIKAAISTDAWIITGGTNAGVMKLVGEAVAEESHKHNLTVIGVATWGKIKNRKLFLNENTQPMVANSSLDQNHTHFIFVDDGSEEEYGKEIKFRANLETEVRRGIPLDGYKKKNEQKENEKIKEAQIPMVLIVVNGGPNTLQTVLECLNLKIPVLLLEGSGGCADVIAQALGQKHPDLDKLIEQNFKSKNPDDVIKNRLVEVLLKYKENNSLINNFTLDNEECEDDFEAAILHTFLNSQKTNYDENLTLALKWNRIDIARDYIFTGDENLSPHHLENLMELALLDNKAEFVSLFLENGFNLQKFLTKDRLETLYTKNRSHFNELLNQTNVSLESIENFIHKVGKFPLELLTKDKDNKNVEQTKSEQKVFLWAVLFNRIEIAKLFLENCENPMMNALLATKLLKILAERLPDMEDEFSSSAEIFESIAIGSLDCFIECVDDVQTCYAFLTNKIEAYDMNVLEMAVEADCQKFLSHSIVQKYLTNIWHGDIEERSGILSSLRFVLSCLTLGTLGPFISHKRKESIKNESYTNKVLRFLRTPQVNFVYDVISFLIFLVLFSYMLLCDFDYKKRKDNYSPTEYILFIWIIAIAIEEIRQLVADKDLWDSYHSLTFWLRKVNAYCQDNWNYLDISGCFLFYIGIRKRYSSSNEDEFTMARVILCIDLFIWYLRLLHVTLVFKTLGPKLVMIRKMLYDLFFFIFLIAVFICAFGVATHASMFSNNEWNLSLIRKIIDKAYWPIYGDTGILDDIRRTECDANDIECEIPHQIGATFSYIATMIYMLTANVLLLNLLIAMFSSTFEEVNNSTNEIWKSQRYLLITHYCSSPLFPPPINLFELVYRYYKKDLPEYFKNADYPSSNFINLDEGKKFEAYLKEKRSCAEHLTNMKRLERDKAESKLKQNAERLEQVEKKLNNLIKARKKESEQIHQLLQIVKNINRRFEPDENNNFPSL